MQKNKIKYDDSMLKDMKSIETKQVLEVDKLEPESGP
jgi:hypothetical protein